MGCRYCLSCVFAIHLHSQALYDSLVIYFEFPGYRGGLQVPEWWIKKWTKTRKTMETKIYQRDLKMDHCPCFLIVLGYKQFSNFVIIYFMMCADPRVENHGSKDQNQGIYISPPFQKKHQGDLQSALEIQMDTKTHNKQWVILLLQHFSRNFLIVVEFRSTF